MLRWAADEHEAAGLVAWLGARVPHIGPAGVGPCVAGGVWRGGALRAVVLFHDWQTPESTLQVSIAGEPGWATRGALRAMFAYAFRTCGAHLLWAAMPADRPEALAFNRRLGFREEARLRDRFGPGRAAVVSSITREEWMAGPFAMKD